MKTLILILVLITSMNTKAEEKLKFTQAFTEIPSTAVKTLKKSFSKEALPYWGVIAGTTGVLYYYDEQIYSDLQKRGRDLGIGNTDNTNSALSIAGHEIVRLPSDTGSFLYFLGDGWMHAGIAGGFMAAGQISADNHDFNTGVMLFHGMFVSTIFNQTLKRSFGRESPEVSTHNRGNTKPFPSFNEYNSRTASYDAMPSGHVMTATLTFTILGERYPDHSKLIYSVGGVWVTALGLQMVNNGVHWASDYPLGIAMGYLVGKLSTQMGKKVSEKKEEPQTAWIMFPTPSGFVATKSF